MMFASSGSGGNGGGGYDDDDYGFDDDLPYDDDKAPQDEPAARRPQSNRTRRSSSGRANADGGRSRSASFQPEERYWTDYLRIALPVIGIILMLGLLWIWASSLLGDDDTTLESTPDDSIGLVQTQTEDPNEVNTEPQGVSTPAVGQNVAGGEIPISGQTTPTATQPTFNPSVTQPPVQGGDTVTGDEVDPEVEAPPADETGEITVGARVRITEDNVNIRSSASTADEPIGVAMAGDEADVASGPEEAEDYIWWEVVFDDGSPGFVVQEFLEVIP